MVDAPGTDQRLIHVPKLRGLRSEQLDLVEAQLVRQEVAMGSRLSASATRANILIGASAVLGGAELVTSSGNPILTGLSLLFYLVAAVVGLVASRSRLGIEPDLPATIDEYADYATISLRRDLLLSRLQAHDSAVDTLNARHRWLVVGVIALALAWTSSGAGTIWGMLNPSPAPPTIIQIQD